MRAYGLRMHDDLQHEGGPATKAWGHRLRGAPQSRRIMHKIGRRQSAAVVEAELDQIAAGEREDWEEESRWLAEWEDGEEIESCWDIK